LLSPLIFCLQGRVPRLAFRGSFTRFILIRSQPLQYKFVIACF
jgi:hypothetical protein